MVDGVCDAAHCGPGFAASDSTAALQSAFRSGAHTVIVKNMGSPWLATNELRLESNQTVQLEAGAIIAIAGTASSNARAPFPLSVC